MPLLTHWSWVMHINSLYVAWWHQAITWTNVYLSSLRSSDFHLRAILLEISQPSVTKISMKMFFLRFCWNPPGANEVNQNTTVCRQCCLQNGAHLVSVYIYIYTILHAMCQSSMPVNGVITAYGYTVHPIYTICGILGTTSLIKVTPRL